MYINIHLCFRECRGDLDLDLRVFLRLLLDRDDRRRPPGTGVSSVRLRCGKPRRDGLGSSSSPSSTITSTSAEGTLRFLLAELGRVRKALIGLARVRFGTTGTTGTTFTPDSASGGIRGSGPPAPPTRRGSTKNLSLNGISASSFL